MGEAVIFWHNNDFTLDFHNIIIKRVIFPKVSEHFIDFPRASLEKKSFFFSKTVVRIFNIKLSLGFNYTIHWQVKIHCQSKKCQYLENIGGCQEGRR